MISHQWVIDSPEVQMVWVLEVHSWASHLELRIYFTTKICYVSGN